MKRERGRSDGNPERSIYSFGKVYNPTASDKIHSTREREDHPSCVGKMKSHDWSGHRITVKARCMDLKRGLGEEFYIRASTEDQARERTEAILKAFHPDFVRKTAGEYQVRFERL